MEKKQMGMAAQEQHQAWNGHGRKNPQTAPESDKDSGFSDVASECLSSVEQTDTEEPTSRWNAAEIPVGCPPPPHPSPRPPPLLILKNLLVDQGSSPDPQVHSWTVRPSFQLLPTSSQILVFPPSITPTKPPPSIEKSTKYLPILNSYPKIAPQPSQLPPRGHKREAESWHRSQTKRQLPRPPHSPNAEEKANSFTGPEVLVVSDDLGLDSTQSETKESLGTGGTDLQAAPISDTSNKTCPAVPTQQQNKSRRFQNTLDVLHRSGLLSIAIKTRELSRLNQATQTQLEKLQEQVSLYTKAMSSNSHEDWKKLEESLESSGILKEMVI
ncbi:CLOCK-interacting pacemaker [Pyxicephalus adspersus]|uniref:CLOCK-interacting pacemaker n=1 Tax=Pyxicephalus adspersus TaxID=30357 RepID=A0AAV2ZM09_PYXAD|nr:TPA: hypothetical protein GDO54_005549 [Pyxicephalus adspersus]